MAHGSPGVLPTFFFLKGCLGLILGLFQKGFSPDMSSQVLKPAKLEGGLGPDHSLQGLVWPRTCWPHYSQKRPSRFCKWDSTNLATCSIASQREERRYLFTLALSGQSPVTLNSPMCLANDMLPFPRQLEVQRWQLTSWKALVCRRRTAKMEGLCRQGQNSSVNLRS